MKKDETLKYELTYANGGFNDGVELKPSKDGKVELKVSLYGGGESKVMKIGPMRPNVDKLLRAYETTASANDTSAPEITEELKRYFEEVKTKLSLEIIKILQEADEKIKGSIKNAFK